MGRAIFSVVVGYVVMFAAIFLLVLAVLVAISWGMSLLFGWLKDVISEWLK